MPEPFPHPEFRIDEQTERKRKMKHLISIAVFLLVIPPLQARDFDEIIENCPDFQLEQYKVLPYITAAVELQNMGEQSAVSLLREYAEIGENNSKVIVLCRMLFDAEETGEFRRPLIGAALFLGNTDYSDWPREPVELVRNIPFLVVRGYFLGGLPESAIDYLEYCVQNCIWKEESYRIPSDSDLLASMEDLLNSDKWQMPLADEDIEFIISQIDQ